MIPALDEVWAKVFGILIVFAPVGIPLLGFAHALYFFRLPAWANRRYGHSDLGRLQRILERVVATPSLFGDVMKKPARAILADIYLAQGRHADVVAQCRAILSHRKNPPALEAHVRRHLADSLEALGQVDEAESHRQRAEACLARAPDDPLRLQTQGILLARGGQHSEARALFERGLAMVPESDRDRRAAFMSHILLACFNAGRPEEATLWANKVLAAGEGRYLGIAHRMAGTAHGQMGRLEEAEEHLRKAHELATAQGDAGEAGQVLAQLAGIEMRRGRLTEAYKACQEAAALDPKAVVHALTTQSQVLRIWGRFEEVLELLRRAGEAESVSIPAQMRLIRAMHALEIARNEAEIGRVDDAWDHVQEAVSELGNDPKLGPQCDAVAAWILALRDEADDSRRAAVRAAARLPTFEHDRGTAQNILTSLGRAACARGDHDEGEEYWDRYLALGPDPVNRPTALYFRGECRRHQGDLSAARADFREAVALGLDTHATRLARQRLRELAFES
jgi:tetratricopeptide (TPR) repeat protein